MSLDKQSRLNYALQARILTPVLNKKDGIEIYQLVPDKGKRRDKKRRFAS